MVRKAIRVAPPRRRPITKEVLGRAIDAEEAAAFDKHQAQDAWFDHEHGTVILKLTDGRVFGAERSFIPSLQGASSKQLDCLQASANGMYVGLKDLNLHINVDGLVARIMEEAPIATGTIRGCQPRIVLLQLRRLCP